MGVHRLGPAEPLQKDGPETVDVGSPNGPNAGRGHGTQLQILSGHPSKTKQVCLAGVSASSKTSGIAKNCFYCDTGSRRHQCPSCAWWISSEVICQLKLSTLGQTGIATGGDDRVPPSPERRRTSKSLHHLFKQNLPKTMVV